jgi:hypothetical protein
MTFQLASVDHKSKRLFSGEDVMCKSSEYICSGLQRFIRFGLNISLVLRLHVELGEGRQVSVIILCELCVGYQSLLAVTRCSAFLNYPRSEKR